MDKISALISVIASISVVALINSAICIFHYQTLKEDLTTEIQFLTTKIQLIRDDETGQTYLLVMGQHSLSEVDLKSGTERTLIHKRV